MLNPIAVVTSKIVASFEAMYKTIDDGWAEARRRMNGGTDEFEREFFLVDDVPQGRLSSDVEVRAPAAASKSKPEKVDYSKMSLTKLRNAYVEMFDEQPDKRLREKSLREYLEGAE